VADVAKRTFVSSMQSGTFSRSSAFAAASIGSSAFTCPTARIASVRARASSAFRMDGSSSFAGSRIFPFATSRTMQSCHTWPLIPPYCA
jgi:hypothetical protein